MGARRVFLEHTETPGEPCADRIGLGLGRLGLGLNLSARGPVTHQLVALKRAAQRIGADLKGKGEE
jgi:hypothetical protein